MPYTFAERRRIHRKAKKTLGIKQDPQDHFTFMEECMQDMVDSGEADDVSDARDVCELLWEEEQSQNDEGDD